MEDTVVRLDPTYLTLLVSAVIPLLVGVVTKRVASSGVKAVTLLFLTALSTAVTSVIGVEEFVLKQWIGEFAAGFVVAVATYYGVYKPTGTTAKVQDATAGFGIGSPRIVG